MRRKQFNKIAKRTLSVITAMVLFSGSLPMAEISEKVNIFDTVLVAHAVEDYSKNPTLYSAQNIIDYSKAYNAYPENHYDDNITINRSDDVANTSFEGFLSLGTPEYPFAGTITFNATATHDINIDNAFFDYVYDYVTIDGGIDSGVEKYMTIKPLNDNSDALLANHVLHDSGTLTGAVYGTEEGQKTPANWTIEIAGYEGSSHTHGSLIGEMGEDAECTVNLINDYSVAVENNISSGDSAITDTGSVCGVMHEGSKLTIAKVTGSTATSITSSSGNAGGLVGTMNPGSTLTISGSSSDYVDPTSSITATSGYAGGLVGYNAQATVTGSYTSIKNTVAGSSGAGGLYGYYKPVMTDSVYTMSLDSYSIGSGTNARCKVSSPIGAGGFFGVLENPSGTITLNGTNTHTIYAQGNGDNTVFGGIIGTYKANSLSDTLTVSGSASDNMLNVNTDRSGNLSYNGGIIGKIDSAYFANISNVSVNATNPNDDYFGGAVACADTGYVYVNNLTLTASSYKGGAVVGHTSNGVVHIAGATNLASAISDTGVNYGQIVGYRDSALVFAESGWNLTRNTTATVEADDIGSWGEVVRFKASDFTIGSVLDKYYVPTDETPYHYATLLGATFDGSKIKLSSKSTFATAALNMQLNGGTDTDVLKFSDKTNCAYDTLKTKSITMTASIDLSHTGMTGLTRDNGSRVAYDGAEFDGVSTNNVLTLAIGEGYEGTDISADASGKGMIYRHTYNGLFGETANDFTIKNVTISGCVNTKDRAGETDFYVGTVAGNAAASFNASGVTVDSNTSIVYATASEKDKLYVGGLVGKMSAPGTSTIGGTTASGTTDSTFSAQISGSAQDKATFYAGGVCGYVGSGDNVNVHDIKITNEISNSSSRSNQTIGGLFAHVDGGTLDLNGVEVNALAVKAKMSSGGSMGGLLGYDWNGVSATFDNIDVTSCTLNNDSSSGNQAALVYTGSGYWKFKDVAISGLTLTGSSASSLGMLVNKAYSDNKAMYLELPSGFTYTITGVTGTAPSLYDEIAVYTIMPDNSIEANGNSVISISTNGTTRYGTMTASTDTNDDNTKVHMTSGKCNTYQNQVTSTGFSKYNANSRYYYNVDNYIGKSNSGAAALYLWSVYQYAYSTIRSNIATSAPASTFSGTLDLDGYSYYPVDVTSGSVNICGSVGLHNEEIETMESNEVSSKGDSNSRTTLSGTQHYLMHAGLFRNVNGTININGSLSISGTVPDTGTYCGALICGTIGGSATADASITSNNTGASISLAGIKVHNKDTTYSPLLINNASTNVVLDIYNVTASGYSAGDEIATSLMGVVGSDTAEKIQVTFHGIQLDGRKPDNSTETGLTTVYGTSHSLFTRATLLESLTYSSGSGSFGIYNYEHSEDWAGSPDRAVTYGIEISDDNSVNKGKEYYYYKKFGQAAYFTNPAQDSTTANRTEKYSFTGFRPYVAVWGTDIGSSSTKHQLDVNHSAATFGGCGTYNHPFTIAATDNDKSGGLVTIAKIITGTYTPEPGYTIDLPDDISTPSKWCNEQEACETYTFDGTATFEHPSDSSKDKSMADVRKYLAGAYYYLSTNIEIEANSGFTGLGNSSDDYAVFRGVIAGNGRTILNKTDAPLIYASNGSVIKNLKVQVGTEENEKAIILDDKTQALFSSSTGCDAYGLVIGRVLGGDNIIDQVSVDATHVTVTPTYLTPVGGYIGVIVNGGVFFRNMDDSHVSAANKAGFGSNGVFDPDDTSHLYCNPIIGRVINGFAVNETPYDTTKDTYAPYEDGKRKFGSGDEVTGNQVTIRNNNKNYSITDLDPDISKLNVSGTTAAVPNSQAFFVMSLIINSGMGANGINVAGSGYYGNNHITRHASYAYVGTDTSDTESAIYKDHLVAVNDNKNATPYLIEKYTSNSSEKTLGSGSGFAVNVNADIILPDGYKGIGNVFNSDTNLYLALLTFDGKSHTISQNTTFYSYESGQDNYLPFNEELVHGIGLFNYQKSSNNNTLFKACALTGNVITGQYSSANGILVNEIAHNNFTGLTAGMLIGTLDLRTNNAKASDIYLQDTYCESVRDAAGIAGYLINSQKTFTIENSTNSSKDSYGIRVVAGTNAAGLVSRQGNYRADNNEGEGNITVNYAGRNFDFVSIISRSKGTNWIVSGYAASNDWTYGVGGLVGVARGGKTNNKNIRISNIKIGSDSDTSTRTVSCEYLNGNLTEYGKTYVGGIVGVTNRAPVTLENCEIYNINVYSSNYVGGVVGWAGTASNIALNNSTICNTLGENGATIRSQTSNAGGVLGFCKNDSAPTFNVNNCIIDSYNIEGASSGGLLGNWESTGAFAVNNSVISKCIIKYSTSGGGIAGQLKNNLYGYNVRVSDITFTPSDTAQQGYICGIRNGTIKIVGFQRTGTISEPKLIGNKPASDTMANFYGSAGYVVFADYEGKSALDPPDNIIAPSIGSMVTPASPYVTVNPDITLDANINRLTGDGISKTAVNSILTDTTNKKYQVKADNILPSSYFLTGSDIDTNTVSDFNTELGEVITGNKPNFPILVIDNPTDAEKDVNKYLQMLTNTAIDFSNSSGLKVNNNAATTDVGTVTIYKCAYSNGTYTLTNNDACLTNSNDSFGIRQTNGNYQYDTANLNGQFTLIDVAFKNPSKTSDVAYHLYVPVIVKKLLEYNFDISAVSGSTYDQALYTGNRGNNVVENLGAPVTMEFEYNYLRNATEWAAESDNAYGLDKYLSFDPQTVALFDNTTTKLVLVDINRGGKEYYLDKWSDGYNSTTKQLNLQAFKDADGNVFSPVTFADMLSAQNISGDQTLKEKYFLTVFTNPFDRPDTDAGKEMVKVIHYSVTSSNIGTTEHPARRVDCTDQVSGTYHYVTHLVIGDFYTNTISVATPSNATERMSNNNKTVTVNISASIDLVNSGTRRLLRDYLGKSNVTIYQSLLASFEKYNNSALYDKGLTAIDGYNIDSYTLTGQNGNIPITDRQILRTANFIEFQNNTDISDSLQNGSVTSAVQATLEFNSENTRKAQFPYRTNGQNTGALVIGYSNISSSKTNTAYSVVSESDDDINNKMYYVESEESAELQYYADYSNANKQNQLNEQLGINAREIESNQTKSFIQTEGRYDTTGLLNASKAQYLECALKLYQKQEDGSYSEVSIDSYLDTLSVIGGKAPVYTNSTTHTYIFDIDDVAQFENEQYVYKIPITFNAITGNQTNFKDTYYYANYKVELTVSLFDHDGSTDTGPWSDHMSNSTVSDWVIYTNARVYTDLINTSAS